MRAPETQKTRTRRRSNRVTESRRRAHMARVTGFRACCGGGGRLTEKLRALKSLLPTQNNQNGVVEGAEDDRGGETEQLFQETADYIIRLRAQVVILQRLIEIYGSNSDQKENVVL